MAKKTSYSFGYEEVVRFLAQHHRILPDVEGVSDEVFDIVISVAEENGVRPRRIDRHVLDYATGRYYR